MKSFFRLTLLFVGAAFLFTSCSKKNEEGKMIPKNAMFVVQLNTKSLKEKLTWDDIKNSNWYNMALEHSHEAAMSNPEIKKILDNPENSGIDLNSSLVFFVGKNPGTEGEAVLEGSIKNADNFAQFNKSFDSSSTINKDGDINILRLHNKTVVAWNDKHFVYAFDASNASSRFNPMNNSNSMGNQTNVAPLVDKSVSLTTTCKNLFSLKSDSSLAENEKFTKLLKENGDIHAWVNSEEIMKSSSALGMLGMLKLDVFFKDNIGTYTVNFDNGKIDINHKGYAGKEFSDFLKKYSGGSINTDMIKTIPSQNVLGVLAMNYKPEAIKELIKLIGMDGMLNMYTDKIGFNLDDFVKANKGDLTLAVSDLSIKNGASLNNQAAGDSTTPSFSKPDFNILFSVSIGDKASFQKLLDAGKKIGGEMGRNDTSIAYGQNDKVFAITNHQHFLNDYLAGNANNKYDFIDKLNGHSVGLYIDIHKILSVLANEKINDADKKLIMDESLKLWNNVYVTTGDFKNNALTGHTEINLIDQSTNSLKQLNHYFDAIAKVEKEKMDKQKSETRITDSLMVPPPIDTVGHK